MLIRELKRLTPMVAAAVLDNGAQYLITVPDSTTHKAMEGMHHVLKELEIRAVIVPESMKFYTLVPETKGFRILYYPFGSNIGVRAIDEQFNDAGQFLTEEAANAWIARQPSGTGYFEARPIE